MKISDLRAKKSQLVKEMRTLADGTLGPEQEKRFDEMKTEIEGIEAKIDRQTYLDEMERRADPVENNQEFKREVREYSLLRAMAAQAGMNVDAGREKEISAELAKRHGRQPQGIFAPMSVFEMERRQWVGISTTVPGAGPGSNIVTPDYRPGEFIDILRAKLVVGRLGARVLSGLTGNLEIPRLKASATGYWVAEGGAITAGDAQFDKLTLAPHHCGALVEYTRNMILQSSPDVEQLVRMDFAGLLAGAVDHVALEGGGSEEPDGIIETAGVSEVDVSLGWTWAKVLEFIEAVETDNSAGTAFCTTPAMVKTLRSTVRETAVYIADPGDEEPVSADYLMEGPRMLAGYPCESTTHCLADQMIFGNWSDLLIGYWSAFDVLVNPFDSTAYPKGNVICRGMMTMDVGVRHAKSFCIADLGE